MKSTDADSDVYCREVYSLAGRISTIKMVFWKWIYWKRISECLLQQTFISVGKTLASISGG